MADRIRVLNRPLPEPPQHVGHFPSPSGHSHEVSGQKEKQSKVQSSEESLMKGSLWKAYLYELQIKAPTPKRVVAPKSVPDRPVHYGREFHGVLSREEAERILVNHSTHSPSSTNKTTGSSGTTSSDGSFDGTRWHHGSSHGTGSSGGHSTNKSDSGHDPDTGRYLVRESDRTRGQYTLSLRFNKVTKNFKLFYDGHKHFVGEKRFDTIHDLVADSLITLYLELHAADYIESLAAQTRYEESPYMTLHRKHRESKLSKRGHRRSKGQAAGIVSSPGHFQLKTHQIVHPQAVKGDPTPSHVGKVTRSDQTRLGEGRSGQSEGRSGQSEGRSGQSEGRSGQSEGRSGQSEGRSGQSEGRSGQSVTSDQVNSDFNVNKRHGKLIGSSFEAIRLADHDDDSNGDIVDGLIRSDQKKNGVKVPEKENKKGVDVAKKGRKRDEREGGKDDGTERSSSVLGACEDHPCVDGSDAILGEEINVQLFQKVHSFKNHNFIGLPFCDFCANFMWGVIGQGVKCEDCGFQAHRKCSEKVPADCCPDLRHIKRVFGIDLTTLVKACNTVIPFVVESCVKEIEYRGLHVEGLYRVSGFADDVEALKLRLECSEETSGRSPEDTVEGLDFTADQILRSCDDVHVITGVLKLYFRLLPIPLITFDAYPNFLSAIKKANEGEKLQGIKDAVNKLPPAHYQTLKFFIAHLVRVTSYEDQNLMTAHNLSTVFCPTLMKTPNICLMPFQVSAWQYESDVIEFLIIHHSKLFK